MIGPSGCGKSTFIRCFNRMNDLILGAKVKGELLLRPRPLRPKVDPVEVRKRIGMVFQKPNPFPKSIYDNVALARACSGGRTTSTDVERALQQAALWDEVKHRLKASALSSREASSSVSASPGVSPSSPTSSSWTSRRPRSTRSRRRGSRT